MKRQLGLAVVGVLLLALLAPAEAAAGHRHHGYHHGHHSYLSFGLHFGYPFYYHYRPYYWPYYGPYPYRPWVYAYPGRDALGALDLKVKPKKTEVWVDGHYVGLARAYDGYPSYLWLEEGAHQLVFYHPGYRTVERELKVYPGVVLDVRVPMTPGESVPPKEIAREPPARYRQQPAREKSYRPAPPAPAAPAVPSAPAAEPEAAEPVVGEVGRLQLRVTPGDASVYLDGRFLGRGEELAGLRAGLVIQPGDHLLEVVRPGHEMESVEFRAEAGEPVELDIELRPNRL